MYKWNHPIANTPSAPVDVTSSAASANSVLLSWKLPPTSDTSCPPATYTITITAANVFLDPLVINTTDNATNKTTSDLNQGMEYSCTVAGVDAGGRVGEFSGLSCIVLDSKHEQTLTTRGKNSSKLSYKYEWTYKNYSNKAELNIHKKTGYPTTEWWQKGKKRRLPYICCMYMYSRCRVTFLFIFFVVLL